MIKVNPLLPANKQIIKPIRGSCWARATIVSRSSYRGGEQDYWDRGSQVGIRLVRVGK